MKAILVVDMPNNCDECEFCGFSVEDHDKRSCLFARCYMLYDFDVESGRHECCPLKPLPQYMTMKNVVRCDYNEAFVNGFDTCLDEILGVEE